MLIRKFHIIILTVLFSCFCTAQSKSGYDTGSIDISGTSNINTFSFHNTIKSHDVNSFIYEADSTQHPELIHKLSIEVADFENDNVTLRKNFLNLLKYPEFPYIYITVSQNKLNQVEPDTEKLSVKLSLTGITRNYKINCYVVPLPDGTYTISGKHCIHLKDFGLEPPSKFFGLIKVNNDVYVNFVIRTNTPQNYYNEIQH
ncbi:YceI family protein [Saccharicrinis sp. FJH2]|uniref:YceI family protein n=1 Tax=Saccharicrinis sp. FJH65 TaxID=3344659 RepID=UPI0035F2AC43